MHLLFSSCAWVVFYYSDLVFVVHVCLILLTSSLWRSYLCTRGHKGSFQNPTLKDMGNESSTFSSECSTPLSEDFLEYQEYQSQYSITTDNRPGSSRHSTRAPSPMEPPEPDLSHLSAEEIAQIKAVMDRAKDMQVDEQRRVRQLEEDYIEYATRIEREASLSDIHGQGVVLCPICNKETTPGTGDLSKAGNNVCVDCEKHTCAKCGQNSTSLTTKMQEWVCEVCERRRKLLMSSGLWYHGSHPETDLPLEKELILPSSSSSPSSISPHQPLSASHPSQSTNKDKSPLKPNKTPLPEQVPTKSQIKEQTGSLNSVSKEQSAKFSEVIKTDTLKSEKSKVEPTKNGDFNSESRHHKNRQEQVSKHVISNEVKQTKPVIAPSVSSHTSSLHSQSNTRQPQQAILPSTSLPPNKSPKPLLNGTLQDNSSSKHKLNTEQTKSAIPLIDHSDDVNQSQVPPGEPTEPTRIKSPPKKQKPSVAPKPEVATKPTPPTPAPKPSPKKLVKQASSDSDPAFHPNSEQGASKSDSNSKDQGKHKSAEDKPASGKGPPPTVAPKLPRGFPNGRPKLFPGPIVHQRLEPIDAQGNKVESKTKEDKKSKRAERLARSSSSETAPSRLKGTGSKSDSDDFSDLASDLDMEEIFGERYRADGASTDDAWDDMSISTVSNEDVDGSLIRHKYRPKSLNLSRSHSLTSSDEEDNTEAAATQAETNQERPKQPPPPVPKKPQIIAEIMTDEEIQAIMTSSLEINECKPINSPTPPRSPSWREGLESPPFSPKRKDNYPGKRRSGSPTSPKEKRHHFSYGDLSPPSRQLSVDELYGDQGPAQGDPPSLINMAQKPSPISPDEIPSTIISTSGEAFSFNMPPRDKFKAGIPFQSNQNEDPYDHVQVMDLATYAATIASSTASLTSMSVSPTNLQVNPSGYEGEQVSPESQDSMESTSPVSPGYYDNVSSSNEVEEVELADPSTKSIDYQGSKRQKARPPTTDWSPVIDLSPIIDVSPSIEEAEHEDMLAKQREEFERQKSREEEIERAELAMAEQDEEEEEEEEKIPAVSKVEAPPKTATDIYTFRSLRRYGNFEDMSKIGDNGLTLSTISDELNGNDPNFHIDDSPPKDEFSMMHCVSLAHSLPTDQQPHYSTSPLFHVVNEENEAHHKSVLETITSIEIRKISQDLEEIARKGVADFKPLPPPKPRRKLPEPSIEPVAKRTPPAVAPKPTIVRQLSEERGSEQKPSDKEEVVPDQKIESGNKLQKQDSLERKTAKYLKARPNPILVEHIESEEQSVSPQYKVLDSPPTPGQKPIKREFSESTSVSPSSSPDQDVYMFPSPVTPPDSDSSPPKPHSPSSTGTDLDDDTSHKSSRDDLLSLDETPIPTSITQKSPIRPAANVMSVVKPISISPDKYDDKVSDTDRSQTKESKLSETDQRKESKKVRRKLPPIPVGEEPVLKPKAKIRGAKPSKSIDSKQKATPAHPKKSTSVSQSDDSMNEEDMEVARITKHSVHKRKPISDVGKAKSFDISAQAHKTSKVHTEAQRLLRARSVGSNQKIGPKDETDAIIDSLISIYNIPITDAMKSLKKRLQDELRRVTRDRKRKIEELEEIRALQMQIGALQLDARHAARVKNGKLSPVAKQYEPQEHRKRGLSPSNASLTPRSSPQVTPRRQRHKRQSSDPMIAKFSPIKEDRDIESDFQSKISDDADQRLSKYSTDDSSQSGLSDCDSARSEPISNPRYKKIRPSAYARMFYTGKVVPEQTVDQRDSSAPRNLSVSRSESQLTAHHRSNSGSGSHTPSYYSDEEEIKAKKQKKAQLQYEIDKRKRQLEETTRLKHELLKLARARQALAHSYDDIPGRYGSGDYPGQYRYVPQRPIPTGIIRPIDDDPDEVDSVPVRRDGHERARRSQQQHAYSSTEYLVHKHESRRYKSDDAGIYSEEQHYSDSYSEMEVGSPPCMPTRMESSYPSAAPTREPRLSGSVTLPDMYHNRSDYEFIPTRDAFSVYSGSEGSPASDYTPAMPLLDDVMAKSRKIIRDIGSGSRPVSAEFNLEGGVEDLMNAMYRVESDNSVDADEPIMKHMTEGGVTILKQLDRKKKTPAKDPIKYAFATKRILVTRDPKDRSVTGTTGNGLGMKIVGGKQIPGTKETGAFVTAIYSGGVADQLHGELEVGDQVLEWNGITLSGKSYEDVQQIISQPNGEIEMVVRPLAFPSTSKHPTGHSNSCHSSYDNLPCSDDELGDKTRASVSPKGVDPQQLAAQLEEIREDVSPENSPSSSQHDFATPSVSSPCSTPLSDPTSTPSEKHQRLAHEKVASQSLAIQVAQQKHQQQTISQPTPGGAGGHVAPSLTTTTTTKHSNPSTTSQSHTSHTTHSTRSTQPTTISNITSQQPLTTTQMTSTPQTSTTTTTTTSTTQHHHHHHHSKGRSQASHSSKPSNSSPNPGNTTSKASPPLNNSDSNAQGDIQIQITHDDYDNTVTVHVIQARNLKPRDLNGLSDPFVKIYLLPGRGAENKRRTKYIPRTLNPEWHQTLIFPNLAREELKNKVLEITVWDYDRFKTNDFLGELIIEMEELGFLDNKPHWYPLQEHVLPQGFQLPKSSVPPPTSGSSDSGASSKNGRKGDSKSPRHHRRHQTRAKKDDNSEGHADHRRRSLDALEPTGDQARISPSRKTTSAHASPAPRRRTRDSRSPNKAQSSGSHYRW